MDGIAANVRIMAVRCVPAGDERDKDVANAIDMLLIMANFEHELRKKYSWDKSS